MSVYSEKHEVELSEPNEFLLPRYVPDWGENGRIHLNGELDFDPEATRPDILEDFKERAPEIGAVVYFREDRWIEAHPGMAAATYVLGPPNNDTVEEIWVETRGEREHVEVSRLIDITKAVRGVVSDAIESA